MSNLHQRETFRTFHRLDVADEPRPTLADREPVLLVWLATAPPPPLPRRFAALELVWIAREHGITVEVEARNDPPDLAGSAAEADGRSGNSSATGCVVPPLMSPASGRRAHSAGTTSADAAAITPSRSICSSAGPGGTTATA
jgi:hypothetical protein